MNASLWQLAGWTMIHSLWLGAAIALAGGFFRVAARRAAPNARYAISLATLALLAAAPIAAATWLSVNGVPQLATTNPASASLPLPLGEGWGEGPQQVHAPDLLLPIEQIEPNAELESPQTAVIELAQATPTELEALATQAQAAAPAPLLPPSALPLPPSDPQSPITSHLSPLIPHLPTLWLIGAPLTFTLLATGLVGSARLRRRATPLLAGPAYEACERLRQTLNIPRRVALAVSDGVAQPILVGVLRPLILLPAAALAGWTPEQLDMVLLHELAHVRRRDNLVNLLQRIVESVLFFHPAVWLVSRQVRRDREECCDAAVIRHTDRPHQYAELLVSIAAALRGGPAPSLAVASAMASHPLAGRIRRILNIEEEPMRITRRTLAATLLLPALLAGAMLYSGANAEDAGNAPPSKGGARGGIPDANQATNGEQDNNNLATNELSQALADLEQRKQALLDAEAELAAVESRIAQFTHAELTEKYADILWKSAPEREILLQQGAAIIAQLKSRTASGASADDAAVQQLQAALAEVRKEDDELRESLKANIWKRAAEDAAIQSKLENAVRDQEHQRANQKVNRARHEFKTSITRLEQLAASDVPPTQENVSSPASPDQSGAATGSNDNNAQPTAKTAPASAPSADADAPRTDIHLPSLQNEIRRLESLILKAQDELTNIEVFKELALQSGPGKAVIEAEVAAELDQDPTIKTYQQNLEAMHSSLKEKISTAENPNDADIQRARATIRKSEALLDRYRQDAEKSIRNRLAKLPNAKTRDALAQYKIRRQAINDNIAKYQQDLEAARTKILQLGTNQAAPAPQPAPLLDRLEQLRVAFDQQRPLFSKQRDEQLQKVLYDGAELPDVVDDHWHYLVKGLGNAPGQSPVWFGWSRLGGKQYEIEVPAAAHEKLFRPLFDGQLPMVDTNADGPSNLTPPAVESSDKAAKLLFTKLGPSLSVEGRALNLALDRANERIAIERTMRKSTPRRSIETTQAELATDRSLLELERDLKNLERKTQSQFPEIESPGGRAAVAETKARLEAIREQLKQEREADADAAPNHQATATHGTANDSPPTAAAPFEGMQEITVAFPSNFPKTEDDYNRIRRSLKADGFKVISASISSIDLANDPLPSLSVFVPKDWHAKPVWETRIDANGQPQTVVRLINEKAPPQPSASLSQAPYRQPPQSGWNTPSNAPKAANDNAMPAEEHGPSTPPSPFPTLENQKIADRAYKLLGLELEPADGDDLNRIKKRGYAGGLRVTRANQKAGTEWGDLLVGLHVWPVTDLKSLDEVLQRDDLGELNPLKYYVIRKKVSGGFGPSSSGEDAVVTGRLQIPDAELLSRGLEQTNQAVAQLAASAPPAVDPPATLPNGPSPAPDNPASVAVVRSPVSSIYGPTKNHTLTTAYLMISFSRPPAAFNNANARLTPQEIELQAQNCLAIVKSPAVLKAALKDFTPQAAQDMWQDQAVERLQNRLSATFPGEGELLELKLEGGDPKEDSALLQAVIDAFIAAMKNRPESPSADQTEAGNLDNYEQAAAAARAAQSAFLYDGKTFEQWRDLWKLELNPERRTEAINALAAFSRTGHGDEAIEAILDVAAEYDFDRINRLTPDGQLKNSVIEVLTPKDEIKPTDPWLPMLLSRLKNDPAKWHPLFIQLLGRTGPPIRADRLNSANIELLKQAAADPAYGPNADIVNQLVWTVPDDDGVRQLVKASLAGNDAENASRLLRNLGFRVIDEYPEKLEMLFHGDPDIRRAARTALYHSIGPGIHDAVAEKLLAILADPKQSARHADAIRALATMAKRAGDKPDPGQILSQETTEAIADRLAPILHEGSSELIPPVFLVAIKLHSAGMTENKLANFFAHPPEERKASVEKALKASPNEEESLIDPLPYGGPGAGDRQGGGFF